MEAMLKKVKLLCQRSQETPGEILKSKTFSSSFFFFCEDEDNLNILYQPKTLLLHHRVKEYYKRSWWHCYLN